MSHSLHREIHGVANDNSRLGFTRRAHAPRVIAPRLLVSAKRRRHIGDAWRQIDAAPRDLE